MWKERNIIIAMNIFPPNSLLWMEKNAGAVSSQ